MSNLTTVAYTDIIPLKKPNQSKEETEKKLLIDVLKPLPKPVKKTEIKKVKNKDTTESKLDTGFILPKKKPLIAGTKVKSDIKISKYYNKKDANLAKKGYFRDEKSQLACCFKNFKKS
tara:strand:+ start:318 stop:671 length:354 start_codon:yes stop_codon:yes gene_type:complete